jgi:DNA-binding transcriptional MocR family regulator
VSGSIEAHRGESEPIGIHLSMPDGRRLPVDELAAARERVFRTEGRKALEYGGNQGFEGLRDWLAFDYRSRESAPAEAGCILLTSGASGGLSDLCHALLTPGGVVLTEQPTFSGSLRTLAACGAEVVGISIGRDGLDPEDLERDLAKLVRARKRVNVLYTVPNFNNPTAALVSLERRRRIAEICRAAGIVVVQDDAFADLSLGPEVPSSFWSLMEGRGVAILGTFSKTLAPGLRLGWVLSEEKLAKELVRRRMDLGVSPLTARAVTAFCESGGYRSHVRRMIPVYRRKRDVLLAALEAFRPRLGNWSVPEGGFSLWIELIPALDSARLQKAAQAEGVLVANGRPFFVDEPRSQGIRVCFSHASETELTEAARRLERALEAARLRRPDAI